MVTRGTDQKALPDVAHLKANTRTPFSNLQALQAVKGTDFNSRMMQLSATAADECLLVSSLVKIVLLL